MSLRTGAAVIVLGLLLGNPALARYPDGGGSRIMGERDALAIGDGDRQPGVIELRNISASPLAGLGDDASISSSQIAQSSTAKAARVAADCEDNDADGVCDDSDHCAHTPSGAIVLPHGCHLTLQAPLELVGVFFDFNGYRLRPESYEILDRVVAVLRQRPDVVVEVAGHTDAAGRRDINEELSTWRAEAVYRYLIDQGIEPYRLTYRGYGEGLPVAPNVTDTDMDNPRGRAQNRRVELRVTGFLSGQEE